MTGESATPQEQPHIPPYGGTNFGSHDKDIYLRPAEQVAREAQIRARAQHRAMEMLALIKHAVLFDEWSSDTDNRARKLVEDIQSL